MDWTDKYEFLKLIITLKMTVKILLICVIRVLQLLKIADCFLFSTKLINSC